MLQAYLAEAVSEPLAWLILLGLSGMLVWKLIGPARANLRLVVQIMFFSVMTAVLALGNIPLDQSDDLRTFDADSFLVVFAQLLWWLHLSWAVIGIVRIYLQLEGRPREARLLQDIVVGIVYLCVALSALAFVFGAPIGTLIATSGVIAITLGLALQNTLGDVFSGIALNVGHAYVLGDWIVLEDGMEGRVVASTWRSTQILTIANNIVVLPNSVLAKLKLTNVSRPDESHLITLTVRVMPTKLPSVIEREMQTALFGCNLIMKDPPPLVILGTLDAVALEIRLLFRVSNPFLKINAQNEVIDRFYRQCRSSGIKIAFPPSAIVSVREAEVDALTLPEAVFLQLIDDIPIFSRLLPPERARLAQSGVARELQKGEVVVSQGTLAKSMVVIRSGVISVQRGGQEVKRLSAGDYFGEDSLLAELIEADTLVALTRVIAYEITRESFADLLAVRPEIADEVAAKLSARSDEGARLPDTTKGQVHGSPNLFASIRTIFSA